MGNQTNGSVAEGGYLDGKQDPGHMEAREGAL